MKVPIKIESPDGDPRTTKVTIDGHEIPGISGLTYSIEARGQGEARLEFCASTLQNAAAEIGPLELLRPMVEALSKEQRGEVIRHFSQKDPRRGALKNYERIEEACREIRRLIRFRSASLSLPGTPFPENDTEEIREACRLYFTSWVEPLLDAIETGEIDKLPDNLVNGDGLETPWPKREDPEKTFRSEAVREALHRLLVFSEDGLSRVEKYDAEEQARLALGMPPKDAPRPA